MAAAADGHLDSCDIKQPPGTLRHRFTSHTPLSGHAELLQHQVQHHARSWCRG
jgi:hypothetical protein